MKKSIFSLLALGACLLTACGGGKSLSVEEISAKLESLHTANSTTEIAAPAAASFSYEFKMEAYDDGVLVEGASMTDLTLGEYDKTTGYSHLAMTGTGVEQYVYVDGSNVVIAMSMEGQNVYTIQDAGSPEVALEAANAMIAESGFEYFVLELMPGLAELESLANYTLLFSVNNDEDPENDIDFGAELGYDEKFEMSLTGKENKGNVEFEFKMNGKSTVAADGTWGGIDGVLKAAFNAEGFLTYSLDLATITEAVVMGDKVVVQDTVMSNETIVKYSCDNKLPDLSKYTFVEME